MKQTLTTLAILFALTTQAQKVDSVANAIQVTPVVVNTLTKDTAYQLSWVVLNVSRDTSAANSYVQLYNRKGGSISQMNVSIPYSVLKVWVTDVVIDDYILSFLGLTKRK